MLGAFVLDSSRCHFIGSHYSDSFKIRAEELGLACVSFFQAVLPWDGVKPISGSLELGALWTQLLKASLVKKELCLLTQPFLIPAAGCIAAQLYWVQQWCLHFGCHQSDLSGTFKGIQSLQLRYLCSVHRRNSPGKTSALTAALLSDGYFNIDHCFAFNRFFILFDHYFLINYFLFYNLPPWQFSGLPTRQMYYVAICSRLELLGTLVLHHVLLFENVLKKVASVLLPVFMIKSALHHIVLVWGLRQVNSASVHVWLGCQLFATFAQIFLQR